MRHFLIAALFAAATACLAVCAPASAADFDGCHEHLPYGAPTTAPNLHVTPICHQGYAALVDDDALVPRWVAYHLTGPHTLGCVERGNNFHPDEGLPAGHRARPADYAKTGYDIGHQAPAQDFGWDDDEMSDSFSLANMAPQLPGLNRMQWERLEESVRAWAWNRGDLLVYVGPVLHGGEPTIGPDHVAVPAAFWKVIVDTKTGEAIGFEMPQQSIPKGDLTPWQKSVADIQQDAQVFLPLPATATHAAAETPTLWPADLSGWHKAHSAACH